MALGLSASANQLYLFFFQIHSGQYCFLCASLQPLRFRVSIAEASSSLTKNVGDGGDYQYVNSDELTRFR